MESYEQARDRQREAAAQRVSARTEARLGNEAVLAEPGGLARVDTEERIAKRLDRLSRYVTGDVPPPTVLTAPPEAIMQEAVERVEGGAGARDRRRAGQAAREDHPHRRLRRRPLPRRGRRRRARGRAA